MVFDKLRKLIGMTNRVVSTECENQAEAKTPLETEIGGNPWDRPTERHSIRRSDYEEIKFNGYTVHCSYWEFQNRLKDLPFMQPVEFSVVEPTIDVIPDGWEVDRGELFILDSAGRIVSTASSDRSAKHGIVAGTKIFGTVIPPSIDPETGRENNEINFLVFPKNDEG